MNNLTRPTRLKILLAQRGMSQKDLAEIAGLEMYQVSLLCSGKQKNLMLETAKKIAYALGVSLDEAFGD